MGKKLYVGNLSYEVADSDLSTMFAAHGTVESAQVIMDRDTGRSKGFGFVEMSSDQEAQAAIAALAALKQRCEVTLYTDSQYLRQGITQWLRNWKRNGWRTTDRKPVRNDDLWRQLDELARRHRTEWKWLKGHAGHPDNERCDVLATAAIAKLRKELSPAQVNAARDAFLASRDSGREQPGIL